MLTMQRDTKQRSAIRDVFARCKRPLSPKELLKEASRQIPQLGIATVYRNIKSMVEKKELVAIEIPGEAPRYALPGNESHSLFICNKTGRVFFLDDKKFQLKVPRSSKDFKIKHFNLFVFGESKAEV
mgnify:FL=1